MLWSIISLSRDISKGILINTVESFFFFFPVEIKLFKFCFKSLILIQIKQASRKVRKLPVLVDIDVLNVKEWVISINIYMHIYKQSFGTLSFI